MQYKVVIIDDEHWTREVIKNLGKWDELELEIVGESSDGDFGLELIQKFKPDIIITDVHMPNMNGIELLRTLRKSGNDAEVIIVSGYDDFEYIHSAMKLDVSDYLLKPIKPEELNEQLFRCREKLSSRTVKDNANYEISATGFLEVPWAQSFNSLKTSAYETLYSNETDRIKKAFDELTFLVNEHNEPKESKSVMICIYYILMNQLQLFINEKDYRVKDFFSTTETSFVFSHDSTSDQMLSFICDLYCKASTAVQMSIKNRNRLDIGLIKSYIEENFTESISLDQTASRFYISKEYLSKVFKATEGIGFTEYITSLRMEKAKSLILTQNIPIKEVGFMVGYVEQAHFYKKFKKYFSMTPGEMKLTLKIDNKIQ
jgi:two-component system response regulator YesN